MILAGGSGIFLFAGGLRFLNPWASDSYHSLPQSRAQSSGSWSMGPNTATIAIHAALLPSGKIFYLAGSGYDRTFYSGPYQAAILDPDTGDENVSTQSEDLFCVGLAPLPNGNVLLAGGTKMYDTDPDNCTGRWHGLEAAYEVGGSSGALDKVASMSHGRWYPTLVTLADGSVFTVNGYDEYGSSNMLVEVYNPQSKTWAISSDPTSNYSYCVGYLSKGICEGAGSPCYSRTAPNVSIYARAHLIPDGRVVICGPQVYIRTWDPSTGIWNLVARSSTYRHYGSTFLLPLHNDSSERGKILLVGGSATSSSSSLSSCEILDFDQGSPAVRSATSLAHGRKFALPVILPNGKLVMFGGSSEGTNFGDSPVYVPEVFDPETETWSSLPAASVPRVYHSVALLLPDGRVWTAGGTPRSGAWELRTEIFSPAYYFETRPSISGTPAVGGYGETINIPSPDAADIDSVSLVTLQANTHHYDANVRLVWLQILERASNSITVRAPINANVAPPGYYMIHVLNAAKTPSVARIIKIPGTESGGGGEDETPPSKVTGAEGIPISGTAIELTWNQNSEQDISRYFVFRSTQPGFQVDPAVDPPIAEVVGTTYTDIGLATSTTYYYRIAAVDTSNNIGPLSDEVSATTNSGGSAEVFYNVAHPGDRSAALLAGSSIRYGIEARLASSVIVGKTFRAWTVYLKKAFTPSGNVTAVIRRSSDDAVAAQFNEVIDSASLSTEFEQKTFTLASPYTITAGDRIMIEYNGPSRIEVEIWGNDQIDGNVTRRIRYNGSSYIGGNSEDVVGLMTS